MANDSARPNGEFRPSKALWFWSCAACIVATLVIGFTWGGWVTGSTATQMASSAAENARAQLVANVCVEKFTASPSFAADLTELKKANSWSRDDLITKGGWVTLAGMTKPFDDAAGPCADKLMTLPTPTASAAAAPAADNS
jgi:hypothetical protein